MGFRGFSASYVAVSPFEGGEGFDQMESDSGEITPFPGYLQSVIVSSEEEIESNYDDNIEDPIEYNGENIKTHDEDEHSYNSNNGFEHYR